MQVLSAPAKLSVRRSGGAKSKTIAVAEAGKTVASVAVENELGVTRKLIAAMNMSGVRYCHWKSNIRLQDTLEGSEDIDLLVHRSDATLFRQAMVEHGFKPAQSRSGIGHPGVFHALSLDETSATLAHLHAYHQLVSGDSLVKNYRFKIEQLLLDETMGQNGVRIPTRESELVLFAIRIALKHVSPIEILMVNRNYQGIVDEMNWLLGEADQGKAADICATLFPAVSRGVFQQLLRALTDRKALPKRIMLGWRIARQLRDQRRLGSAQAVLSRMWRVKTLLLGRLWRRRDLALQSGGLVVALVGPKATGKSTLSAAIAKTFGSELNVKRIHVGKPPATALTFLSRLMIPLARQIFRGERPSEYQKAERREAQNYSLLYVFYMTLLAYDRHALLRKAFRTAAAGGIVVCDRYPSASTGSIDSSCFDDAAIAKAGSSLKRRLMIMERSIYRGIPKPDLVLRLVAPIDTSIQRDATRVKPGGPDAEAVQRRWAFESQADFSGVPVVEINTNRSIHETVRHVVSTVWAAL
jgi:thymidylate kinase